MPTIYVSKAGNSSKLRLRDSENHDPGNDNLDTQVDASDTITWMKDPRADSDPTTHVNGYFPIGTIVSVTYMAPQAGPPPKYQHSTQLLTGPVVVSNSVGTGTVLPSSTTSPRKDTFENYQIGYTLPGDSTVLYDDPKLIMN